MVDINLTLVVQAINFVCAYVVLKKFLWRPVIASMQEDEARVRALADQLEHQKSVVHEIVTEKECLWLQARATFANQIPVLTQKFDGKLQVGRLPDVMPLVVNEQVYAQLVDCVVARVRHG